MFYVQNFIRILCIVVAEEKGRGRRREKKRREKSERCYILSLEYSTKIPFRT